MKFLCDQCKAKYQISDDKVAGKTVRMKCRKCGHLIEVRAAVTETSVAAGVPSEPPPAMGARPPPPKPATLPTKSSLATSLSQAKPPVPRPGQKPEGGLAGAFKQSMHAKEDEAALLELSSADEWYAAINGVPVGPIRIGELRRKAALGAVTDDSLVWQEGMEEWRPVRTVPELAALVREAALSGRVSLVTPDPPNTGARGSVLPPAPQSMRPGVGRPAPPRPAPPSEPPPRAGQAAARSNVVPITSRLATAERLEEAPAAAHASPMSPASERFSIAPDPFSVPPPAAAAASAGMAAAPAAAAAVPMVAPAPRQPNYIAIGMIVGFAAFGITLALVFRPQPPPAPPPQVIVQQLPAPVAQTVAAPEVTAAPVDSSAAAAASGKVARGGPGAASAKPAASSKPGVDLSGLLGGSGPNVGPGGGPTGGGGSSLTASQIEPVVRSHSLGIRRTCWERGSSSINSANETLSLTIGGDGRVQNAQANGNDTVTGSCLEKEVRGWTFPATGATSKVDIPFHFVRQ